MKSPIFLRRVRALCETRNRTLPKTSRRFKKTLTQKKNSSREIFFLRREILKTSPGKKASPRCRRKESVRIGGTPVVFMQTRGLENRSHGAVVQ